MNHDAIERITHGGTLIAIIIPVGFRRDGIEFFTPDDFSQQIAYMNRPAGHRIPPHVHNPVRREVTNTLEVLFVRSGRVRVDFYSAGSDFIGDRTLATGDVILLASGGHGFTMLEPTEMIEVKQGPYAGDADKTRFDGIHEQKGQDR
jgi:mannose-6-phosphate isomerase-like protein (cupin superfamily)